jgi:hypothetical protein
LKVRLYATTLAIFATAATAPIAYAQASPTATQALQLSVFGAGTGTYTGLHGGRNLGVTAGADLGFHSFRGWFYPSLEIRGTYPFVTGQVVSNKNILGGIKFERYYGRFRPYADILYGRAETHFESGGFPNPEINFIYTKTPANVLSPGVGVDVTLTDHFALKADFQFQRYATPVTTSRRAYAKPLTLGVVYRFNFNRQHPR